MTWNTHIDFRWLELEGRKWDFQVTRAEKSLANNPERRTVIGVDLVQTLAIAGISMITASVSLFLGFYGGRQAANDAQFKLRADFDSLATSTANLAGQTRDHMERAYQHAQRAAAHTSVAKTREERAAAETPAMNQDEYISHLQKGGSVIPEVEAALGLTS